MTTETAKPAPPSEDVALIEAMIAGAETAPEPGSVQAKDVIHRSDAEVPVPMVARQTESAGYVTLYNTRTGDPGGCNRNMLPSLLKERFTDGAEERVFTVYDPGFRPFQGNVRCFLHLDEPRRAEFDALGLPVCDAAHLANDHQRDLHMRHRHKTSWETLERMRIQAEKDEDRAFQRSLLRKATGTRTPRKPREGRVAQEVGTMRAEGQGAEYQAQEEG